MKRQHTAPAGDRRVRRRSSPLNDLLSCAVPPGCHCVNDPVLPCLPVDAASLLLLEEEVVAVSDGSPAPWRCQGCGVLCLCESDQPPSPDHISGAEACPILRPHRHAVAQGFSLSERDESPALNIPVYGDTPGEHCPCQRPYYNGACSSTCDAPASRLRGGAASDTGGLSPEVTPEPEFVVYGGVLTSAGIVKDGSLVISTGELDLRWSLMFIAPPSVAAEWVAGRFGRFECVTVPDMSILLRWSFIKKPQVKSIAMSHHVRTTVKDTRDSIIQRLSAHKCDNSCSRMTYVFHMLANERRQTSRTHPSAALGNAQTEAEEATAHARNMADMMTTFRTRPTYEPGLAPPFLTDSFHLPYEPYPEVPTWEKKKSIIRDFQDAMDPALFVWHCCAVCGQRKFARDLCSVDAGELDLDVLRNDNIPSHLWPTSYDFRRYGRAFLDPRGMKCLTDLGMLSVCSTCNSDLEKGRQPPDSLANFHYFAYDLLPPDVRIAFNESTPVERMLVSACRTTQLSFTYTKEKTRSEANGPFQHYMKGNVAVIPQDVGKLARVLPPSPDDMGYSVCVLFVGHEQKPDMEMIRKLHPLLVRKERVETMLRFLVENNRWYRDENVSFSPENLAQQCSGPGFDYSNSVGVPSTVEIQYLPYTDDVANAVNSGPVDHNNVDLLIPDRHTVLDVTGYIGSEQGSIAETSVKARAMQWCLDHKPFLAVRSGNRLFPERDPRMLTFAFPHLDPWGIAGFNNPLRDGRQQISMKRQVKNLIHKFEGAFNSDPQFAYVCFNAIQKLESYRSVQFSVKPTDLYSLTSDLMDNRALLEDMATKWADDPNAKPSTRGEKRMAALIRRLEIIMRDIHGSNGRKVVLRNEIRAMLKGVGCPALFLTLNPADLHNKLFHVLAGGDPDAFARLTEFERLRAVADNPDAGALFFHLMIESFTKYILRFGSSEPGLFGVCTGYYGTVEAQGRGSLHCHMLIWLRGNMNPQKLRDRLVSDPEFKEAMFGWLESIIKCEPPDMERPQSERTTDCPRPARDIDVRTSDHPWLEDDDDGADTWQSNYTAFVTEMAVASNWHDHKATCWKYLKDHEPRDDAHCRMRMDGHTRLDTTLDPESAAILLRRWHPKINNYNDLVLFLYKCNMDIKFIGSGEAAKALVYYVTDYITKSALPFQLALQALCWAVKQNEAKFEGEADIAPDIIRKSLLVKSVNSMMARQEQSHQQVMSWLIGGGDHYSSHTFKHLCFGEFDRYIGSLENPIATAAVDGTDININADEDDVSLDCDEGDDADPNVLAAEILLTEEEPQQEEDDLDEEEEFDHTDGQIFENILSSESEGRLNLRITKGRVVKPCSLLDHYRWRGRTPAFNALSLWDHVAVVEEISLKSDKLQESGDDIRVAGERVMMSPEHPHYKTHVCRLRTRVRHVPNFIGPRLPRLGRSTGEEERYYRAMLILFKPWRALEDLKHAGESWGSAFHAHQFPPHLQYVIDNIHIEDECRDAREEHDRARRSGRAGLLIQAEDGSWSYRDTSDEALAGELLGDTSIDTQYVPGDGGDMSTLPELSPEQARKAFRVNEALKTLAECGIVDSCAVSTCAPPPYADSDSDSDSDSGAKELYPEHTIANQRARMSVYKKDKRPRRDDNATKNGKKRKRKGTEPEILLDVNVESISTSAYPWRPQSGSQEDIEAARLAADNIIRTVMKEKGVWGNVEQSVAVGLVGKHLTSCSTEQLLMYVAGEGGTGKSHVIDCIVELFRQCGVRARLLLSAPTGIASILISGYTIHALTFLPRSEWPVNIEALHDIWKDVDYLIVDEVSMISSIFLAQAAERVRLGRGSAGTEDRPFGGVNVIFMGDFGQLRPVGAKSLFADDLVRDVDNANGQSFEGQTAIYGASVWRQMSKVVKLEKNWRHNDDPPYAAMVSRIRQGQGTVRRRQRGHKSDYEILSDRQLNVLSSRRGEAETARQLEAMQDCPIVVADKQLRDAINAAIVQKKAREAGAAVHCYMSQDRRSSKDVTSPIREALWGVRTSLTRDSLGSLPLFIGMKVMFTENIDIGHHSVNGAEGTVTHIKYTTTPDGHRVASVVYVHVPGSKIDLTEYGVPYEDVPVFPTRSYWKYTGSTGTKFNISRSQLPLVPAYAYTDYKSQGRSLVTVIADIAACRSNQSLYVMLSRVRTLGGLGILRPFPPDKINQGLSHELRRELARIDILSDSTISAFVRANPLMIFDP